MITKSSIALMLKGLLVCAAVSWSTAVVAFVLSGGQEMDCKVQTVNGEYRVPERLGYAGGFAGFTDLDTKGLPYFIFDKSKFPLVDSSSSVLADFLFYHECAHARFETRFSSPSESELGANCEGLRKMRADGRISAAQEIEVGRFFANANINAKLFGTGAAYWELTLSCASKPSVYIEVVYGRDPPPANPPLGTFWRTEDGAPIQELRRN